MLVLGLGLDFLVAAVHTADGHFIVKVLLCSQRELMDIGWFPGEWKLVDVFLDVGEVWSKSKDERATKSIFGVLQAVVNHIIAKLEATCKNSWIVSWWVIFIWIHSSCLDWISTVVHLLLNVC